MGGYNTDSAGAISRAYNGTSEIPKRWVGGIEDSRRLQELGERIFRLVEGEKARYAIRLSGLTKIQLGSTSAYREDYLKISIKIFGSLTKRDLCV